MRVCLQGEHSAGLAVMPGPFCWNVGPTLMLRERDPLQTQVWGPGAHLSARSDARHGGLGIGGTGCVSRAVANTVLLLRARERLYNAPLCLRGLAGSRLGIGSAAVHGILHREGRGLST